MAPTLSKSQLNRRVEAALGKIPCDVLLQGVEYLDVFSADWKRSDIAVYDGVIVGLDGGLKAKRTISGRGKWCVPGFIDAHLHVESSLLVPHLFDGWVAARGTTAAVCDPHELANVIGVKGIEYFLQASERMNIDLHVMLSSCVPATHLESNGGGTIHAKDLVKLRKHPKALGLAEMMNVPGVLSGDPEVMDKLEAFSDGIVDGHCPLVREKNLSAYALTGISSCHESTRLDEAQEKLTKGMAVWIREGSVAKDLKALSPLLTFPKSMSVGFCTDDRNPMDIAKEGHLDHLIRASIKMGIAPEIAFRCASLSVARHYGLRWQGAIAPGFQADLVLLDDMPSVSISQVLKRGIPVEELAPCTSPSISASKTVKAKAPLAAELEGPKGRVHVIGIHEKSLLTDHAVMNSSDPGVLHISVIERHGHGRKPANGYITGFGKNVKGAIASSVGHDSHNLVTVGSNTKDMAVAIQSLIASGGGFCVVQNEKVLASLALPIGGLMTEADPKEIVKALDGLRKAGRQIGCEVEEPFLQMAFVSLPVIPSLKLTDKGLVDVEKFEIIAVAA